MSTGGVFTQSQEVFLALSSCIAGSLSAIASTTILFKICHSRDGLRTPYARILFGLALSDICVSLGNASSTFFFPKGMGWKAIGNEGTCTLQGFISLLGAVSTPFYNLSLCIYYLCVVKYSMRGPRFREKVEPYLHLIPLTWSLFIAIYSAARGIINPGNGMTCYINPYPKNCHLEEGVTCERGEHVRQERWIFVGLPTFLIIIGVFGVMLKLGLDVRRQEKTMEAYSFRLQMESRQHANINSTSRRSTRRDQSPNDSQHESESNLLDQRSSQNSSRLSKSLSYLVPSRLSIRSSTNLTPATATTTDGTTNDNTATANTVNTATNTAATTTTNRRRRRKSQAGEIFIQAKLYFLAFLATFAPIFALVIAEGVYGSGNIPFPFYVAIHVLYPLQGVFNILVFIRPQVSRMRRSKPEYSYLRALCSVLISGDISNSPSGGRRRSSRHMASVGRLTSSATSRTQNNSRRLSLMNSRRFSSMSFLRGSMRVPPQDDEEPVL